MKSSKDVATLAGVSIATVSRVFFNPELVSDKTKERVFNAAAELDYSPNLVASSLRSCKSRTIGIIINDIKNPFYLIIAEILAQQLKQEKYQLMLSFCDENQFSEKEAVQMLISSRVEGMLFTPTSCNSEIERILQRNKVYSLQLYRDAYQNMDTLAIDDEYGAFLATEHLLEKGHTKILLLDLDVTIPTGRDIGYEKAFVKAQKESDKKFIVRLAPNEKGYKNIKSIIEHLKPTAIIPVTTQVGLETVKALKQLNLSFPKDISLIMYDDDKWADIMGISCISHPVKEIGSRATKIMLEHLTKKTAMAVEKTLIQPILISRTSTRKITPR